MKYYIVVVAHTIWRYPIEAQSPEEAVEKYQELRNSYSLPEPEEECLGTDGEVYNVADKDKFSVL